MFSNFLAKIRNKNGRQDPKWQRAFQPGLECACCGQEVSSLLSFSSIVPDVWPGSWDVLPNSAFKNDGQDFLTEDLCVLGEHRFVRCIMDIPLQGYDETFFLGMWGSLSQNSFEDYLELFSEAPPDDHEGYFSYLSNNFALKDVEATTGWIELEGNGQRPRFYLSDETHPLYAPQNLGMTFDEFADFMRPFGHEL